MKKITLIFLLITYSFTSFVTTIHLHYFMAKFVGWSLLHSKNEKCGKCGMKNKKTEGCCKNEDKQIKIIGDQNHQIAEVFLTHPFFTLILLPTRYVYIFRQPLVDVTIIENNVPPPKQGVPIYIFINIFRI